MKADLALTLRYEAGRWRGRGHGMAVAGRTLGELDSQLRAALHAGGRLAGDPPRQRVTVFMGFDFDTLPRWLRQYAAHYFNRTVVIDLQPQDPNRDPQSDPSAAPVAEQD